MESYLVPFQEAESEFTEKRSRFISHVWRVESEAEARARIEEVRKKHYDARHNCWCYLLQEGGTVRYSDDGEPQGTAGQPMLNVFQRQEVWNACCVVTRYFGGVLLGTGGLVRAYTQAVKEGLRNCVLGRMRHGWEVEIGTDYNCIGKILYLLGNAGVEPLESNYADTVSLRILVSAKDAERMRKEMVDATNGKVSFEKRRELYFVDRNGKAMIRE